MDILFLDANILFSAAYQEHAGLLQLWKISGVKLITSAYALEEAQRNLREIAQQKRLIKLIETITVVAESHDYHLPEKVKLAEKDKPILAAAIAAKADYLITGDYKDFGAYYGKKINGVKILPPREYLNSR